MFNTSQSWITGLDLRICTQLPMHYIGRSCLSISATSIQCYTAITSRICRGACEVSLISCCYFALGNFHLLPWGTEAPAVLLSRVWWGPKCSTGRREKPQSRAGEQPGGNRRNSWSKTEGWGNIQDRDEAGWSGTDEVGNRWSVQGKTLESQA